MCELSLDFELNNISTPGTFEEVPTISSRTYEYFFKNFLSPNLPCIIKDATRDWTSALCWVSENKPNWLYLSLTYGCSAVTVYDCKKKYFNSHNTSQYTLNEYLEYWQNRIPTNSDDNTLLYLKDWHLKNEYPDDNFYNVPLYFASDWLNEYLVDSGKDDYRFVYMGPKDTWTPFHADVFMSYSWSANLCGKKKWILFPPGEESMLKDALGSFCFDISDKLSPDIRHYVVVQNPGEALFVPSGWYHQVWNLEDTISVNHNWINGCNIGMFWKSLSNNYDLVKKQIEDCRDMDNFIEHCQLMLGASYGMDFHTFFDFLNHIASRRILIIKNNFCEKLYNGYIISRSYASYDLKCIKSVLESFIEHDDFHELFMNDAKPHDLLGKILVALKQVS